MSSQTATSILLIMLEVSVKATHWYTACSQRTIFMLLILQEVSVKATHLLTRVSACSQTATSMLFILLEVTVKATDMPRLPSTNESFSLSLLAKISRLLSTNEQPNNYFYATYHAGSVSESNSLVHKSHSLILKNYLHATYSTGSNSESNWSVDNSHYLHPNS